MTTAEFASKEDVLVYLKERTDLFQKVDDDGFTIGDNFYYTDFDYKSVPPNLLGPDIIPEKIKGKWFFVERDVRKSY